LLIVPVKVKMRGLTIEEQPLTDNARPLPLDQVLLHLGAIVGAIVEYFLNLVDILHVLVARHAVKKGGIKRFLSSL